MAKMLSTIIVFLFISNHLCAGQKLTEQPTACFHGKNIRVGNRLAFYKCKLRKGFFTPSAAVKKNLLKTSNLQLYFWQATHCAGSSFCAFFLPVDRHI